MEVEIEQNEEGNVEDNTGDKPGSGSAAKKQVSDPVVYKLVRVDFDGRLIPATEDELMEVEDLLELEKNEILSVSDVVETVELCLGKDDTCEKPLQEYEGSSSIVNAVDDGEKLKALLEETLPISAPSLNDRQVNKCQSNGEESSLQEGVTDSRSSGSKPNFSWLKGEINLDRLTIRELQETFRATFGRGTSVKDKQWLKRRIAMGLTNSCDVSVTSFVIKDGSFLDKKEEIVKNRDNQDSVAGEVCSADDDMTFTCQNLIEDSVDDVELRNSLVESGCKSDDLAEQIAAKRVRKPTKRYIEESSDKETRDCSGKLISSAKRFGVGQDNKAFTRSPLRPALGVLSGAIVTRPESIGGSGVQVPYISRVRRCRPRKSIMALTKFQPSEVAMTTIVESSVAVSNCPPDDSSGDRVLEVKPAPSQEPLASEADTEKLCLNTTSDISCDKEPKDVDSSGEASRDNVGDMSREDNVATVPTSKGGMRRKHHRAWTLTEVVKLVDGVSRFGAGRWSEIKRLSFSSHSHRTSVDLKDKWRNLLKASFANPVQENGGNARKNGPAPIPAPILVKVRELAEINGQAPTPTPTPSPRVFKASSDNTVNETTSAYL